MADLDRLQAVLAKLTREEFEIVLAEVRATRREAWERAAEIARNCTVEQYGFQTRMKIHDAIIAEIDTISSLTSGGKPTRGT